MGYPHKVTDPLYILAILSEGTLRPKRNHGPQTVSLDMNFLMTIAVLGAAVIEEWLEGATVIFLFSVTNLLQNYTMNRARNAIRSLMGAAPNEVTVERNGREEKAPTEEIRIGEKIIIKPGEKMALDGRVLEGLSYVNQAPITGESLPVAKKPGDLVFAGTINQSGSLEVEVSHAYQDTTLSKIIHLVEEAQAQKAPSQSFVERFTHIHPGGNRWGGPGGARPALGPWLPFWCLVLPVSGAAHHRLPLRPGNLNAGIDRLGPHCRGPEGVLIKGGVHLEEVGRLKVITLSTRPVPLPEACRR